MVDISKSDFSNMTQEDMIAILSRFDEIKRHYPISHIFFADAADHEFKKIFGNESLNIMGSVTRTTTTVSRSIPDAMN